MSSFFSPEDVTPEDMQELRVAQLRDSEEKIIPLPIGKICETICNVFSTRVSMSLKAWTEFAIIKGNAAAVQFNSFQKILTDILVKTNTPLEVALGIVRYRKYGISSLSCESIADYRLDIHIHQGLDIFKAAMDDWLNAERAYLRHQPVEKLKSTQNGNRENQYILIYISTPLDLSKPPVEV